jgi:hypothetical protein
MTAFHPLATIKRTSLEVRFGPKPEVAATGPVLTGGHLSGTDFRMVHFATHGVI